MERHFILVKDHRFVKPVNCDSCHGRAHLIRRSPHPLNGLEMRVFECHECGCQAKRITNGVDSQVCLRTEQL
jgi:hypothetical protein